MTLADVAHDAGVAINTVRKTLADDPTVRPDLRERVLASAKRLEYRPNVLARGLRNQKLDIVPISIAPLQELFFAHLADHLSKELVASGLEPALCTTPERLFQLNDTLCTCGSILAYADYHELTRPLAERQPVVTINGPIYRQANLGCVVAEFRPAFRHAAEAVLAAGRRRVAVLSHTYDGIKAKGYSFAKFTHVEDVLDEHGLGLVRPSRTLAFPTITELIDRLAEDRRAIDAVFCRNDLLASQLVAALGAVGCRTPDDVLVVGCDANLPLKGCWSVRIDTADLARKAVRLLKELLAGAEYVEPLRSRPCLVDDAGRRL